MASRELSRSTEKATRDPIARAATEAALPVKWADRDEPKMRAWRKEQWALGVRNCVYCETDLAERAGDNCATTDHRQPLSRGGVDEPSNYAMCCWACNRLKGRRTEEEFRVGAWVYFPWDEDRKRRASVAARRRLGVPDGHRRVYGVHVPEDIAGHIRTAIAKLGGMAAASEIPRLVRSFIREAA